MFIYDLPSKSRNLTPVNLVNRHAAATGSMAYASATAHASYNGHSVSCSYKPHAMSGPIWNTEYWWAGRVVLARGSFARCLGAAVEYMARGDVGGTASVSLYEAGDGTVNLNQQIEAVLAAGGVLRQYPMPAPPGHGGPRLTRSSWTPSTTRSTFRAPSNVH